MPDTIPDYSPLPYMIGRAPNGAHYAYSGSLAVRRIHNTEVVMLRDEHRVRTVNLDQPAADLAATVSKFLFNV